MSKYKRIFIQNSYLFITIVTNHRHQILVDNIDILRLAFKNSKMIYSFEIFASVILPDHMHLLLRPEKIEEYPKIIRAIKYSFSKNLPNGGIVIPPYNQTKSKLSKGDKGIWQRRYWEHSILDDEDLYKHLDYIHYNPVKHGFCNCVKDWKYSSFDKFVKLKNYESDWSSHEDIKIIETLNYD